MVTITTDNGEFTGETTKDALRAERKAELERRKQEQKNFVLYASACDQARSNGFRVLERMVSGEEMRNGWRFHPATEQHGGFKIKPRADSFGRAWDEVGYSMEGSAGGDGYTYAEHYGYRLVGVLTNGAGFVMLSWIVDRTNGHTQCLAVGCKDNVIGFEHMPDCVKPELFAKEE